MIKTVPLKSIVKEYLSIDKNQSTLHSYPRVLGAAIAILREIEFDLTSAPIYKVVEKDSNGQIDLPTDCVRFIDIGVINRNGEFVSLERNPQYTPNLKTDACGDPVNMDSGNRLNFTIDSDYDNAYGNSINTNRHGESTGRQYGLGGHSTYAQYGVDEKNNKINISTDSSSNTFVLVYMSNLEMMNGEILVNHFMSEPIKRGIEWMLKRGLKSTSPSEKEWLEKKFTNAKYHLSLRLSSMSFEQMMFAGERGTKPIKT